MKFKLIIEQQAAEDITAHAFWIAKKGAPASALRWAVEIEDAIATLASMPERCPLAAESELFQVEIRQLLFKSHRILFLVKDDEVHILHVRHVSRLNLACDS